MKTIVTLTLSALCCLGASIFMVASRQSRAQEMTSSLGAPLLPNAEFREGDGKPLGWNLSGGVGQWLEKDHLEVVGDGTSSNAWMTSIRLVPGERYAFAVKGRRLGATGGCAILGPAEVNHDWLFPEGTWELAEGVFRVPDHVTSTVFRLGQWQVRGRVQFDSVALQRVVPVYAKNKDLVLGRGERTDKNRYFFSAQFGEYGSNDHRVLARATASYNSSRWVFSGEQQVVYHFHLPAVQFVSAELAANVNYYVRGELLVEVSCDGEDWQLAGRIVKEGTVQANVPSKLLPAEHLWLRLRGADRQTSLQVDRIDFQAITSGALPSLQGRTTYAVWQTQGNSSTSFDIVQVADHASLYPMFEISLNSPSLELSYSICDLSGKTIQPPNKISLQKFEDRMTGQISVPTSSPGRILVSLTAGSDQGTVASLTLPVEVHEFHRADYGYYLQTAEGITLWWCEADWKVSRQRPPPAESARTDAMRLAAAKNDHESAQLVLRTDKPTTLQRVQVSDLVSNDGHTIPADRVSVCRVHYHFVHSPTDRTGLVDWWPDALPPINGPLDLQAGQNQPLWITVAVPPNAVAGEYRGHVHLKGDDWAADVPLVLRVWDFALPERNHVETAFGFDCWQVFRYHNVTSDEDRRKLLDLYFQSFRDHRISPYNPVPLDPFRVKFEPTAQPPRATIDFTAFDRAMSQAIEKYRFTNFMLTIQGMGGGTFHDRVEPSIAGFGENTPEYQAMFSSQVQQIEEHLREKGWLPMAYVYWFDEPEPKDYEFVRGGMARLKKYAPALARMLTEEPVEPLFGYVDIWCPITPNYQHEIAQQRRQLGERFWWYVCTGPKAPYCTLFIDHPATELRVWLWQTWQRRISGVLVWATNYWTSSAAFPDTFQDPYDDPMSYVSGYSTPAGVKRHWGNGDGRFIYPPPEAATPGKSPQPVLAPPVSSIRWEMLREGIEDYEMLWQLADLLRQQAPRLSAEERDRLSALLEVPPEITRDMTEFTRVPQPIYHHRQRIAQAIERLQGLAEENPGKE